MTTQEKRDAWREAEQRNEELRAAFADWRDGIPDASPPPLTPRNHSRGECASKAGL